MGHLSRLALLAACLAWTGLLLPSPPAAGAVEGTVRAIVQSDNPSTLRQLKTELQVKHDFGSLGFSAVVTESQLRELQSRAGVRARQALEYTLPVVESPSAVQEDKEYLRPGPFVPPNVERLHAPAAWEKGITGKGVKIAFIDTGIDTTHPDLKDSLFLCVDLVNSSVREIRSECPDYVGHGTHVAGIGAANGGSDGLGIFGVAPGAGIGMARVCPGFICLEDDIAAGIRLAAERGAQVISISLGGSTPSEIIHAIIQDAVSRGVVVVAAAGNSGPEPDTIAYPAAHPEVIAVAATEHLVPEPRTEDQIFTRVADFSSRGTSDGQDSSIVEREVELAAPGRSIFSTCDGAFDGGDAAVDGYCSLSGTSMATPGVAGVAALIVQFLGPESMTSAEDVARVRAIWISRTGETTFDITADCCGHAGRGYDIASGYGMPEMDKILSFLEGPKRGRPGR